MASMLALSGMRRARPRKELQQDREGEGGDREGEGGDREGEDCTIYEAAVGSKEMQSASATPA